VSEGGREGGREGENLLKDDADEIWLHCCPSRDWSRTQEGSDWNPTPENTSPAACQWKPSPVVGQVFGQGIKRNAQSARAGAEDWRRGREKSTRWRGEGGIGGRKGRGIDTSSVHTCACISIELRSAWRHARQQQGLGARGCSCRGLHRARLPATSQEGSGSRARARLSMARAPGPPCVCGARGRDILTMRRDTRGDALHGACGHMTVDNLSA